MSKKELLGLLLTILVLALVSVLFTLICSFLTKSSIKEIKAGFKDVELIDNGIVKRKKKPNKAWKIAKNVLFYVSLGVLIPVIGIGLYDRWTGNQFFFGDKAVLLVASGSMSRKNEANTYLYENDLNNQFDTYDLVTVRKVKNEEIKLYDVIAYKNRTLKVNIIHRVIGINDDGTFLMRGDANNANDEYRPTIKDVIGKYEGGRAKKIGIALSFLQSYSGILTIATIIYLLIMLDHYLGKVKEEERYRENLLFEKIELPEDEKEIYLPTYKQTVKYQKFIYEFSDGALVEKKEDEDSTLPFNSLECTLMKEGIEPKVTLSEIPFTPIENDKGESKEENGEEESVSNK